MARNFWVHAAQTKIAANVGAAKTLASLSAAAGIRFAIQTVTLTFDGTSNTAQPIECHLQRITTLGGTSTAQNPAKKDSDIATALQLTGQVNFTVEPTAYTANTYMASLLIHPQAGLQYPMPLPGEVIIPGGGIIGLWINAPAAVNCLFEIEGEE